MNVTPALPSPNQPPAQQQRTAVGAVSAAKRARDATDDPGRRQPVTPSIDPAERERLSARADGLVHRTASGTLRANRALAAYAEIADQGERSDLRDLLGFDAYA